MREPHSHKHSLSSFGTKSNLHFHSLSAVAFSSSFPHPILSLRPTSPVARPNAAVDRCWHPTSVANVSVAPSSVSGGEELHSSLERLLELAVQWNCEKHYATGIGSGRFYMRHMDGELCKGNNQKRNSIVDR